jgi:Pyruvate/2-oxoacid:ferredoxin oxidoreductase gamma subunit
VIYDESVIASTPALDGNITVIGVPCTQIANDLGNVKVKNVVAMGALQGATSIFPPESFGQALRLGLKNPALIKINEEAFEAGRKAVAAKVAD